MNVGADRLVKAIDYLSSVATTIGNTLSKLPPVKWLQTTYLYLYLEGVLVSTYGVFFQVSQKLGFRTMCHTEVGTLIETSLYVLQKLGMFHLDHIDFVGGPVKGLTVIVTGPTR